MWLFKYLWALPTTVVGLSFAGLAILTGGKLQISDGVLEATGGVVRWFLTHCVPIKGGVSAMALGHVVLGVDRYALERTRGHERAHVRQCERWGPLFIPAYLLASLWQYLHGRQAYHDNPFERAAREGS